MDLKLPCFVSPYQLASALESMSAEELRDFVNEMLGSVSDESAADIIRAFYPKVSSDPTRPTPASSTVKDADTET